MCTVIVSPEAAVVVLLAAVKEENFFRKPDKLNPEPSDDVCTISFIDLNYLEVRRLQVWILDLVDRLIGRH